MERIEEGLTVKNSQGLHARPAAEFVQLASRFDSSVKLRKDDEVVDGKSILAVLSLGASSGAQLSLIVEGDDAKEAFLELKSFLEKSDD